MVEVEKKSFAIELGPLCNNHCVFCVQAGQGGSAQKRLDQKVLADLDRAEATGFKTVTFVGGEPTMHEGLIEWIRLARARSFECISVQSNGRRLALKNYAEGLIKAGLTHVEVSLQGHHAALHDYHTQLAGSFRETAKGLLNLRALDVHVGVSTVITRSNFRDLEGIVAMCAHVQAAAWHVAPSEPIGAALDDFQRIVPNLNMTVPYLSRAVARCMDDSLMPYISGVPLCLLEPRYRAFTLDLNKVMAAKRAAIDSCIECVERQRCSGLSTEYLAHFASSRLSPIDDNDLERKSNEGSFPFAGIGKLETL